MTSHFVGHLGIMPSSEHDSAQPTAIEHLGTTADGRSFVRVVCSVEPVEASGAPEWVHVVPAGPFVEARDRRVFKFTSPEAVLNTSELPLLLDWEHLSEQPGGSTRAAGWIEELRFHDGSTSDFPRAGLWARANWTPEGKSDVEAKAYRYLSPVLLLDAETREIQQLVSVALTNTPALRMHAVEQFRERLSARYGALAPVQDGESAMKQETVTALCTALGVAEGANEGTIVEAATQAAQLKETCARLTTELAAAQAEVEAAKAKIAEIERAQFAAEVEAALSQASREGKVPPAAHGAWREFCSVSRANLEMFTKTLLRSLPVLCAEAPKTVPGVESTDDLPPAAVVAKLKSEGLTIDQIRQAHKYNQSTRAQTLGSDSE